MFIDDLEDHGLPLVQLKEQRRDMVVALMGRTGPITKMQIAEIAEIQQAIAAAEAVIVDLDTEFIALVMSGGARSGKRTVIDHQEAGFKSCEANSRAA
jgi:hypothetical protein